MEKKIDENSTQKCWYCKRNNSDSKYLNNEKEEKVEVTIKGFYKYKKKSTKEWKVVRCKECYEIHQKGNKLVEIVSLITYLASYILLCYNLQEIKGWLKFIIFIYLAGIPTYVFAYIFTLTIGYFYAYKYNIKTKWSRGGDVL